MRIESVALHRVQIPLKRAFAHAASSRTSSEAILVQLRGDEGHTGWGEIRPRPYVTGETMDGVLTELAPALGRRVMAAQWLARDELVAWLAALPDDVGLATRGGFECALLDAGGRRFGFGFGETLPGPWHPGLPPGVVVGLQTPTAKLGRHCAMLRLAKRRHVKVKVGVDDDVARLKIVTDVFGPDVPLRIDANAAWTVDETLDKLASFAGLPIASIEQPIAKDDIEGLAAIRARGSVPVMADEAVCSVDDARRLVAAQAVDIFNVRVGKHGGILASHRIVEIAEAAGVAVHLGTLVGETGVLSRVGEVFGAMVRGFACLDGKGQAGFLLAEDVLAPGDDGKAPKLGEIPVTAPGLGVAVDEARVERFRVGDAVGLG